MKVINYSRLNQKNKDRVNSSVAIFEPRPSIIHHSAVCTRSTKVVRSMISMSNPSVELSLVVGGRVITTQIDLDK